MKAIKGSALLELSILLALFAVCLWVSGCSRAQAAQEDHKHDHAAQEDKDKHDHAGHDHAGHVHADGTPATQAEWCSLNGVSEARCASVLAEYKAKGDWCEVHSLPKSRCMKCNPSLTLKPAKAN